MGILSKIKAVKDRHEEGHRPSGLGLVLGDRIDFLNVEHWDGVVDRNYRARDNSIGLALLRRLRAGAEKMEKRAN